MSRGVKFQRTSASGPSAAVSAVVGRGGTQASQPGSAFTPPVCVCVRVLADGCVKTVAPQSSRRVPAHVRLQVSGFDSAPVCCSAENASLRDMWELFLRAPECLLKPHWTRAAAEDLNMAPRKRSWVHAAAVFQPNVGYLDLDWVFPSFRLVQTLTDGTVCYPADRPVSWCGKCCGGNGATPPR